MLMNDKEECILNLAIVGLVYKCASEHKHILKLEVYDGTHCLYYESKKERDADHARLGAAMCGGNQITQQ